MKTITFVSFDIETTGLTDKDKIIEFGAVRVEENEIKETFQSVINPDTHIPLEVLQLTGIKDEEIRKAPHINYIKEKILDFLGNYSLVAHNAPFDISFIKRQVSDIKNEAFDTLKLSRILLPFVTNHKLGTLYRYFENEESNFHRALDDSIATAKVFQSLLKLIAELPGSTLEKILRVGGEIEDSSIFLFRREFNQAISTSQKKDFSLMRSSFKIPNNFLHFRNNSKNIKSPPTEESVGELLKDEKTFRTAVSKFEKRDEQIELSKKIINAFLSDGILVSEAGTGTGKTFAYLIPSILWSNYSNERILISTYTKNLEEQLFHKDIINISKGLKVEFKAALLKGRNNYLCLKKWSELFNEGLNSLNKDERESLLNLIIWHELSKTGDISENSSFWQSSNLSLWSKISCDTTDCEMNKCSYFDDCYLTGIRRRSQKANIVVINHSLLFSDLISEQKILGEYNRLIIDEAHNLKKAATDFLGTTVTYWQLKGFLDRLHRGKKGLLVKMENTITILGKKNKTISLSDLNNATKLVKRSMDLLTEIFETITDAVKDSEYTGKLRLKEDSLLIQKIKQSKEDFCSNLQIINNLLMKFIKIYEGDGKPITGKEIAEEVTKMHKESQEIVDNFKCILSCSGKNSCFWAEAYNDSKNAKLVSAPIVISDVLRENLFSNLKTAVLVSATILVENSFNYFKENVGLSAIERVNEFALGSSFDFKKQVLAIIPAFIASPQKNEFLMDVVDILQRVILSARKGTLVLFTSYRLLNMVYEQLIETLHQNNIILLAQGRSGSRTVITKEFKNTKNSILFGTYSFWEGFDAPGEALEALIIIKLPFSSPKEPITEARAEYIESEGLNPFEKLYIPEAVIKLRQGFGRLIRTKDDRGIILILDNRLVKRNYGEIFFKSLPTNIDISYYEEDFFETISSFWKS